jgi:hypothetical protein
MSPILLPCQKDFEREVLWKTEALNRPPNRGRSKTLLAEFGATLDDVVEECLFVLDVLAGFAAAAKARKELYGTEMPQCASSIVGVFAFAQPVQLVEITFRAVIRCAEAASGPCPACPDSFGLSRAQWPTL